MVSLKSFKLINEIEECEKQSAAFSYLSQTSSVATETLEFEQARKSGQPDEVGASDISSASSGHNKQIVDESGKHFRDSEQARASNSNNMSSADRRTIISVVIPEKMERGKLQVEVPNLKRNLSNSSSGSSSISIVVNHQQINNLSKLENSNLAPPSSSSSADDEIENFTQDELSQTASSLNETASNDIITATSGAIGISPDQVKLPMGESFAYRSGLNSSGQAPIIIEDGLNMYMSKQQQLPEKGPDNNQLLINNRGASNTSGEHFEIVWSNLSYKIEPKWYKKFNYLDRVFSHILPGQTIDNHSSATSTASSSANMQDNQHQMHFPSQTFKSDYPIQQAQQTQQASAKSAQDPIEIFTNLNGTIKSGQMTAVLGPSGAGKTTLLNCLTGKLRKGVSGHINLIGANGKHLKMCTIPQKDHLLELLTVEENLWFASKIKNPEYGFDHVKNIERVVDLLGLKRCRSAKIKKISGGQHKRVSIAQELLSNPDILVLDEPTSGLDSLTCFKTISMLRDLVELSANNDFMKPMAIIVTIHQPQPKVFNLFHHVYILANGGRVIYEGAPEASLSTITSVTGLRPIDTLGTTSSSSTITTTTITGTGSANKGPSDQLGNQGAVAPPGGAGSTTVDPASFLIEIASEEYGLETIKTLNDYQRKVFYETNVINHGGSRNSSQNNSPTFSHYSRLNHAYESSDSLANNKTNQKHLNGLSSTMFVDSQQQVISAKGAAFNCVAEEEEAPEVKGEISGRKKIKRRKRSTYSLESGVSSSFSANSSMNNNNKFSTTTTTASQKSTSSASMGSHGSSENLYMSEQLLYTREANHKGRFWSHTATLTHRTLLTIRRDPLLMTSRVLFHLMIPILMGHVYGKATGAANACPHYEPEIDITQIPSLVEGKRIEYMLEELHMSIENVSMFFIIMYAFAAAVLALNALSFPLNMQVLLKETRNGWYSMSSYVLAKTLADLPLELTMPCLTMALVYPLTGQPSSYLQWRMLTICLIMTLCSLIAQTQALILGALVMNSVQTAVFVSQASQLPWVILAGFTIRIKRLSEPLKLISLTSFYRLGCEAITLTRYGFGICPCNPKEISGEPVKLVGIPDQLRTLAQYWIESMEASKAAAANDTFGASSDDSPVDGAELGESAALTLATTTTTTTTLAPSSLAGAPKTDIFQHLANQLSYANSYGVNITSCDDVAPDRIRAINLGDNWLVARIWHLFIMLIIMKILLYYAVKFSIGIRL